MTTLPAQTSAQVTARPTLQLRPHWSSWLFSYWALTHAGALAISLTIPVHWAVRLLLAAVIAADAIWIYWTNLARQAPWSIREVSTSGHQWELVLATGETVPTRPLASSFIGRRLVILNFARGRWWRRSLPLPSDSLDADTLRRLRATCRTREDPEQNDGV